MEFGFYLSEQIKKHPYLQPQDVAKLCYQAAFGAEHLLSDVAAARRYLYAELDSVEASEGELFENISEDICRVNLAVWKARGLPYETLFEIFLSSVEAQKDGKTAMQLYLAEAERLVNAGAFDFSVGEWKAFMEKYTDAGMPAVHHSGAYRAHEKPSYRIVKRELVEKY